MTKKHNQTTKPRSLVKKSRLERYLELMTIIMGQKLFKYPNFLNYRKISFFGAKKPPFKKKSSPNDKTISLLQKGRLERYLELMSRIMGYPPLRYANFYTIVKCRFYSSRSLLLRKEHQQTTRPMSLVQKSRLERYLEVLTSIN